MVNCKKCGSFIGWTSLEKARLGNKPMPSKKPSSGDSWKAGMCLECWGVTQ